MGLYLFGLLNKSNLILSNLSHTIFLRTKCHPINQHQQQKSFVLPKAFLSLSLLSLHLFFVTLCNPVRYSARPEEIYPLLARELSPPPPPQGWYPVDIIANLEGHVFSLKGCPVTGVSRAKRFLFNKLFSATRAQRSYRQPSLWEWKRERERERERGGGREWEWGTEREGGSEKRGFLQPSKRWIFTYIVCVHAAVRCFHLYFYCTLTDVGRWYELQRRQLGIALG